MDPQAGDVLVTVTCYAQTFEDVLLWQALQHLEKSFDIEIGAQDSVVDCVSLSFHEQG